MGFDDDSEDVDLEKLLAEAAEMAERSMKPQVNYDTVYGTENQTAIDAMNLREISARYLAGNPFKAGDLVTPRRGYAIRGVGFPCLVLDVFDTPSTPEDDKRDDRPYRRNDMRIARIIHRDVGDADNREAVVTFMAESYTYEPYTGPIMSVTPETAH
jgi:hypothetical protein